MIQGYAQPPWLSVRGGYLYDNVSCTSGKQVLEYFVKMCSLSGQCDENFKITPGFKKTISFVPYRKHTLKMTPFITDKTVFNAFIEFEDEDGMNTAMINEYGYA